MKESALWLSSHFHFATSNGQKYFCIIFLGRTQKSSRITESHLSSLSASSSSPCANSDSEKSNIFFMNEKNQLNFFYVKNEKVHIYFGQYRAFTQKGTHSLSLSLPSLLFIFHIHFWHFNIWL